MNESRENKKVYLLCRYAMENSLYISWLDQLPMRFEVIEQCAADWVAPSDCGLLITHEHYRWEELHCLRAAYEQSVVPILVLADGVLEYRNTWQNPTIPDASIYQPLLAHKIACIGESSARLIEFWGNPGKTEVVGLPRLDNLLEQNVEKIQTCGRFRLLVTTATTPAFTDAQRRSVIEALTAVKQFLEDIQDVNGRPLDVSWRLTDGLEAEIGIDRAETDSLSLTQSIQSCDAVITTPSTLFLESAVLQRPTAILDFTNSPLFVPAAWTISAAQHIPTVIDELADPPPGKLVFQDFVLRDNLSCGSPAAPRLIELVSKMVTIGIQLREQHRPISFPARILDRVENSSHEKDKPNLCHWFPSNPIFREQQPQRLQAELSQAIHRLGSIPRELADKNNQVTQLQSALDESRRRVADVRTRLFKLRKILGIGKENQDSTDDG